jgi:pimeloyl-ACP methyl ester carboxylesterase
VLSDGSRLRRFRAQARPLHVYGITRRGIGASDQPTDGYDLQRSSDDVLEVLDALQVHKPILVANSCGGWVQTRLAAQHPDRLGGLVYLEAADDPTLTLADYHLPPVDTAHLPKSAKPAPSPDYRSFEAYRTTQRRDHGVAFPEAELRQLFARAGMGRWENRCCPAFMRRDNVADYPLNANAE